MNGVMKKRAEAFRYVRLEISSTSLTGHFELDGVPFEETVSFENVDDLTKPAVVGVANLWFLLAGLSYYKAGAAKTIDLGTTPVGPVGRELLGAALHDGLGEFSFKNDLSLNDVVISGGVAAENFAPFTNPDRVLIPFGGGIDSVVSVTQLSPLLDKSLFVVSPVSGRFAPLEETALVTGLSISRATRIIDSKILKGNESYFNGHVPVTAMITLLGVIAAVASGRGGVVMSNEHSSSAPNLKWNGQDINHQWSKSWVAEQLISKAVKELLGDEFVVASFLRDRSEVWVAQQFADQHKFLSTFRSCNRAFSQEATQRAKNWCGECDKCLFINLILAPFLPRATLRQVFGSEPLSDPNRIEQLRALVGIGLDHKPFECVGDPDESAVALVKVSQLRDWEDVPHLAELALLVSPDRSFDELLESQGPSNVPANWLR